MWKRGLFISCVLAAVLLFSSPATADVTDFTWSPSAPVMGEVVTYTAVNNGSKQVTSWKWEYRYTSGACAGTWVDAGWNANQVVYAEERPGTWDVRLTATYAGSGNPPGPPPPPAVITKQVTIAPATHFVVVSGFNSPENAGEPITLRFRIHAASRACGNYLATGGVMAQERLTNIYAPAFEDEHPDDTDWMPEDPTPEFHIYQNEVYDVKQQDPNGWEYIYDWEKYLLYDLNIRLRYTDPCNDVKYINLGHIRVARQKLTGQQWQYIIEQ